MSENPFSKLAYEGRILPMRETIRKDEKKILEKDNSGRLPIHWAASGGHGNVVDYLLQVGSPADEGDDTGWTPLMIASSSGKIDIVKVLLGKNAMVNVSNQTGQTPLHYAASKNHVQVAKLLLEHGSNINAADNMGSTPLHRAASKGNLQILDLFLGHYKNKLNLDVQDCVKNTPLHLACEDDMGEAAKQLIKHGASTDIINKEKKMAFDLATPSLRRMLESSTGTSDSV